MQYLTINSLLRAFKMLVEFKVANYRSIRDLQTLSMVAGTGKELEQNTCRSGFDPDTQLVRTSVIYGPNAGGKTNLIRALHFMRYFVLSSAKESQQGEEISVESFLFDKKTKNQPSEFHVIFCKDKVRYQYGFILDKKQIKEEWLFAYPSGRIQRWFSRKYDKSSKSYRWKFSKYFTGKKQFWADSTRGNSLFLSTAVQLNNKQLLPIFSWFQKELIVISSSEVGPSKTINHIKAVQGTRKVLEYMNVADPTIADISVEFEKLSEGNFPPDMPDELKKFFKDKMKDRDIPRISFTHPDNIELDFSEESEGTKKLFYFSGYWIDALKNGKVIVVDELDNSLHPLSVRFLITLMVNSRINKKNAQLIFSTHDTSQLDKEIFRRDQIWFVEKDKDDSTKLYSLLEFSPRKNEALARGYLQGRYGALPYVGNWGF